MKRRLCFMKIIVYGLGKNFMDNEIFLKENYEIVGYIDKNISSYAEYKRYELDNVACVDTNISFMITSSEYCCEMINCLCNYGIEKSRILYIENEIARHVKTSAFKAYGQFGEDYVIFNILKEMKINLSDVKYLELGVNYPMSSNNTYNLDLNNAMGWLVEANPDVIPMINVCRKNCRIINKAIVTNTNTNKTIKFYVADNSGLSSVNKETVGENNGSVIREVEAETITIENLIDEIGKVHVLSMDVEGLDEHLLLTTDWKGQYPNIICAETRKTSKELAVHMEELGYELVFYNGVNTIWKKE